MKEKGLKVCADIGGTKTFVSLMDKNLRARKIVEFPTGRDVGKLLSKLDLNLREFSEYSGIFNLAVNARVGQDGRITNEPKKMISGINFFNRYSKLFKNIHVDNDGTCFALKETHVGALKGRKHGLVIVWGTGLGGAIVADGMVYRGGGHASEMGRIRLFDRDDETIETLVAGKGMLKHYGYTGAELQRMAENGDRRALAAFHEIGKAFGRYLVSLYVTFDPEVVVIGGSFVNSWKFMEKDIRGRISALWAGRKVRIALDHDRNYVIHGSYFLDE